MSKSEMTSPQDHVARLIMQRRVETPGVPLDGMEIFARARRLTMLSRATIEAVFEKHGIDTGEFDVLATLSRSGSPYALRPTELYQSLMISSGGLTDRLSRLESKGLVKRVASAEDRRSSLVQLTAKGQEVIDRAFREDMAAEQAMLSSLSKAERAQLALLLARLLEGLEASS